MNDKQIIINGCDVSGCDFYDKNEKYCLTLKMNTTGFKNPSCFSGDFQECIQDSKVCPNTFCDNNHNCYYKQLQKLKIENEGLKEIRENLHKCNIKIMDEKHNISIKNVKLQHCLDEIVEICEECKKHDYDLCITCKYEEKCRGKEFEQYDVTNYILEKIKEVKDNE